MRANTINDGTNGEIIRTRMKTIIPPIMCRPYRSFSKGITRRERECSPLGFGITCNASRRVNFTIARGPMRVSLRSISNVGTPRHYRLFIRHFMKSSKVYRIVMDMRIPPVQRDSAPIRLRRVTISALVTKRKVVLFRIHRLLRLFVRA